MKTKLLAYTPNPEKVVANSARLCYSSMDIDGLFDKYTDEQNKNMIDKLINMGHESPLEHITFTFGIEGVSRALTHQLIRHRIASYSQQSQRYVNINSPDYVVPNSIRMNTQALGYYFHMLGEITTYYNALIDLGIPKEDARYLLPNACETKIVVTMNARSLMNFFKLRCCNRAQWEIRELADKMLIECKQIAPNLFRYAGANCMFGNCPEGNMSCGSPRRSEEYQKEEI